MKIKIIEKDNSLYHWGILGQKWGVRRFQNEDGTLTSEGKARYYKDGKLTSEGYNAYRNALKDPNSKFVKDATSNKELIEAFDSIKEKEKIFNDFQTYTSSWENTNKLLARAKEIGWDEDDGKNDSERYLLSEKSPFKVYCDDKGIDHKKFINDAKEAQRKYEKECQRVCEEVLGELKDESQIRSYQNGTYKVAESLKEVLNYTVRDVQDGYLQCYLEGYQFYD